MELLLRFIPAQLMKGFTGTLEQWGNLYRKVGSLEYQKWTISQFWRPEGQSPVSAGSCSPSTPHLQETLPHLLQLLIAPSVPWLMAASLQPSHCLLPVSLHTAFPLRLSVPLSKSLPLYKGTPK